MKRCCWILLLALIFIAFAVRGEGLKTFKLNNGASLYIWEDSSKPDMFGMVTFKVGSVNDPGNFTGLAHYLEHVMFKGTQKIGALDWSKEGPMYEKIIAKYDEMAAETESEKKEIIGEEINRLTIEAAKYSVFNEFANLVDQMGGAGLNAATSFDYTIYYNSFPANQLEKWLELYSERFINPVFRAFQTELETVYEEYNMNKDDFGSSFRNFVMSYLFEGHPYARPVIGKSEHLKNPRLSKLIQFYNDWYTPDNMAIILVGDVHAEEVLPLIREKFERIPPKPKMEEKKYPLNVFKGRKEITAKVFYCPMLVLNYNAVSSGHPDEVVLEVCKSLLSNSLRTGLLDKQVLDGGLMSVAGSLLTFRDGGKLMLSAVPSYDENQGRWESLKTVEKVILKEIAGLQEGEIEEWLLESIKSDLVRDFELKMETNKFKADLISSAFVSGESLEEALAYKERVMKITVEEIKAIAQKYFNSDVLVLYIQQGALGKEGRIEKPGYEPLQPTVGQKTEYAKAFEQIPVPEPQIKFCDFNQIRQARIRERSRLFYNKNPENGVFTLTLKYGVGTARMPALEYAVELMNDAGIKDVCSSYQFKQEMSKLKAKCRYRVNNNYLYIEMQGYEEHLKDACLLLSRQVLMPQLDEEKYRLLVGSENGTRKREKKSLEAQEEAVLEYMLYKRRSNYLNRIRVARLRGIHINQLAAEFQRATDYEAEIHYVGTLDFEKVYDILSSSLPLKVREMASTSPEIRETVVYKENTVFFLPNNEATQSRIYFYVDGKPFDVSDDLLYRAFSAYFGEGFGSLVWDEIREKRSIAYASQGKMETPPVPSKNSKFIGFVGTQGDKTLDAIDVYMSLLKDMPVKPELFSVVKQNIQESMAMDKPGFRQESLVYEAWKRKGYFRAPNIENSEKIKSLTFDDILKFYDENIKGKTYTIAVVGNPKLFNVKELAKYGKLVRLSALKIFSQE